MYGYSRPTTPNLEQLAKDATVCDNAYTLGPFTQVACIQLFTSSRPLSYGGYDSGALGRPKTLFKQFRDAGYRTWGLSTIHWVSPYYGYTDGLDEELGVFHLNTLVGMAVMNMRDSLRLFFEGRIEADEMMAVACPVIEKLFDNVRHYCDTMREREPAYRKDFPNAKIVQDAYDYKKVHKVADAHAKLFAVNQMAYIKQYLSTTPNAHEWMARDWRYCRRAEKLVSEAWFRCSNILLRKFAPEYVNARETRVRYAVDAHAIADRVIREIKSAPSAQPFFIWAHFKDNHQPYVSGSGMNWHAQTRDYLKALDYPTGIDPSIVFRGHPKTDQQMIEFSALYDASVRSTDAAIGKILQALEDAGRTDDTVVGFAGDHGEELGDHGDFGHLCMQYDHNARIPMMFRGPGTGGRDASLMMSLDFAPTVASLAGIEVPDDWEGAPLGSAKVKERSHVVMENFCRGNCVFEHRPIYLAVRTPRYKYLWREGVDPHHTAGLARPELFDLENDPTESKNIYNPNHPEVILMNKILATRLAEIPEVSRARIKSAFGADMMEEIHESP